MLENINSFEQFANLLGFQSKLAGFVLMHKHYYYKRYFIKKRNGSKRFISYPEVTTENMAKFQKDFDYEWDDVYGLLQNGVELLRNSQIFIKDNIFSNLDPHVNAFGFVKYRSPLDMAKLHEGKDVVIALDIKNFFNSTLSSVLQQSLISNYGLNSKVAWAITEFVTYNGRLPQGCVTSPMASNIAFYTVDTLLTTTAVYNGFIYTRYADDMVFSKKGEVTEKDVQGLISSVEKILKDFYYKLNKSKTKIMYRNQKQQVLGYIVNNKATLDKTYLRTIRSATYNFIYKHKIPTGKNPVKYRKHLLGIINYVRNSYNGESFNKLFEELKEFDVEKVDTWITANYKILV